MPWPPEPAGSDLQIESPQMKSVELRTTASVPAGQTLLVGGLEALGISPDGPRAAPPARTGRRLFMLVHPTVLAPSGDLPRQTPAKADRSTP